MNKRVSANRKFLIYRLGMMRTRAGLSARELSERIGKSKAYISKFENGDMRIPTEVLLDAIDVCEFTYEEFFYKDLNNYNRDKLILKVVKSIPKEEQEKLIEYLKNK